VVCWSGLCGLGSIEIGSLGLISTLPLDHKSGSPESQLGFLPDINKPPFWGFSEVHFNEFCELRLYHILGSTLNNI
jgi:hypothetical protein